MRMMSTAQELLSDQRWDYCRMEVPDVTVWSGEGFATREIESVLGVFIFLGLVVRF